MSQTKIFTPNEINKAAALLKAGQLVAFPTETVYGLGADATNKKAVQQVYRAKGRPSDNPLIVHVASFDEVKPFAAKVPPAAEKLAETFWPGPLTLILPVKPGALSLDVTGGLSTAAFRMPENAATLALIRAVGHPLVGPSANTSGKPSPTSAQHVYHDLHGKIAGILDTGETQIGVESTVLDLSSEVPTILRPGQVTKEMLEKVIGAVAIDRHLVDEKEVPKSPGMKYKHYSPNADVYIVPHDLQVWQQAAAAFPGKKVGILAPASILEHFPGTVQFELAPHDTVEEAARNLFAGLRALDEEADVILAAAYPEKGLGAAYMNRLKKAAGGKFISRDN